MVKITLEFANIDAAIVALGKLAGAPSAPSRGAAGESAQAPVTDAPATRQRKGRSDKGQPRGEYKPRKQEGEPSAAQPAGTGAVETAASAVASEAPQVAPGSTDAGKVGDQPANPTSTTGGSSAPVSPTATRDQAISALEALVKGVNLNAGLNLLQEFGVERLRALPDDKLGAFVARATALTPKAT